jgi:hypothetical protein
MSTRRAIRLMIALYPRRWRRRYGSELEDLVLEAIEHRDSSTTVVLLNLVQGVANERLRALPASAPLIAVALAGVVTMTDLGLREGRSSTPRASIASILRAPSDAPAFTLRPRTRSIGSVQITLDPLTGAAVAVTGAPANVVIDPGTDQPESVTQRSSH